MKIHHGYSPYLDLVLTNVRNEISTKAWPNARCMIANSHLRPVYVIQCSMVSLWGIGQPLCALVVKIRMDTRSSLVTTVLHVRAWSIIRRIAMSISMLNGSILSDLGWSSTLHGIYDTRYYHVQQRYVMDTHSILTNVDMDQHAHEHHEHPRKQPKKKYSIWTSGRVPHASTNPT